MKVAGVSAVPLSRSEAREILMNDYLVNTLMQDDWAYCVSFDGDAAKLTQNVPLAVSITVERITPIRLILGGNA